MNAKTWLILGATLAALAVACGAFGAHFLPDYYDLIDAKPSLRASGLQWWETAARYQMYQALGMLAAGLLAMRTKSILPHLAGLAMFFGTLIFSGCLDAMALSGILVLGAIVPIGGLLMILGWVLLAVAAARMESEPASPATSSAPPPEQETPSSPAPDDPPA